MNTNTTQQFDTALHVGQFDTLPPLTASTTTPTYSVAAPEFTRNLQPGQTGADVKKLQDFLVSQGVMTTQQVATGEGIYGPQTTAAVSEWQRRQGLDTGGYSGYFGPKSQQLYHSLTEAGATTTQAQALTSGTQVPTAVDTGLDSQVMSTQLNGGVTVPTTATTFDADVLTPAYRTTRQLSEVLPDLAVAGTAAGQIDVSSGIAGIVSLLSSNAGKDPGYDELNSKISDIIGGMDTQTDDLTLALGRENVPEMKKQLQELNLKISQITGEIDAFDNETAQGFEGITAQTIPQGLLVGQSAAYQRQRNMMRASKASELASYASLQQAYSQNMEIAIDLATTSVDYKWQAITNQLKGMQSQLAIAKDVMDKADAKQLRIVEVLLADQLNQISSLKASETEIGKMTITAALNGAPLDLLNKARLSGDTTQAASILQAFLAADAAGEIEAPTVKVFDGIPHQWNSQTQRWEAIKSEGLKEQTEAQLQTQIETSKILKNDFGSLLTHEAFSNAINPNWMTAAWNRLSWDTMSGATKGFITTTDRLINDLTFEKLVALKAAGATFGALSDNELRVISSSATALGDYRKKDKEGNTIGYAGGEGEFEKEIKRIQKMIQLSIDRTEAKVSPTGEMPVGDELYNW